MDNYRNEHKLRLVKNVRRWAQLLVDHGVNPTFTITGLSAQESEAYFTRCEKHNSYYNSYVGRHLQK